MAEIVQETTTTQSAGTIGDAWSGLLYILKNYWWVLLLICIIIAVIVIAFVIWKKKEENDKRRDSAVYATAMNLWESAEQNSKTEWVRNYYSLWNLLWLGIPFKRNEHSVRITDIDRNLIGWYRGHTKTQDGDTVFLMYKSKWLLGLLEEKFLMYCPSRIRTPKMSLIKGNKVPVIDEKGNPLFELRQLPEQLDYDVMRGNEIRIRCNTVTKQGNYYRFPNYVLINDKGQQEHIDMTYDLTQFIAKTNFVVTLESGFSDMSRAIGRAAEFNPYLRYKQKEPEKEKNVEEDDTNTQE